jgi:hypothetical protein
MEQKNPPFRLIRIAIAAVLAELIPLVVLVATITVYSYAIAPGLNKEAYQAFADSAGKIIGPGVGTLATLGMAYWAARKFAYRQVMYGLATGVLVIILEISVLATPKADFDFMNVLVLLGKLLAGALGGFLAMQRYKNRTMPPEGHRIL